MKRNARGFSVFAEIRRKDPRTKAGYPDGIDESVRLIRSSRAGGVPRCWIFQDGCHVGDDPRAPRTPAHLGFELTPSQARRLANGLLAFLGEAEEELRGER